MVYFIKNTFDHTFLNVFESWKSLLISSNCSLECTVTWSQHMFPLCYQIQRSQNLVFFHTEFKRPCVFKIFLRMTGIFSFVKQRGEKLINMTQKNLNIMYFSLLRTACLLHKFLYNRNLIKMNFIASGFLFSRFGWIQVFIKPQMKTDIDSITPALQPSCNSHHLNTWHMQAAQHTV